MEVPMRRSHCAGERARAWQASRAQCVALGKFWVTGARLTGAQSPPGASVLRGGGCPGAGGASEAVRGGTSAAGAGLAPALGGLQGCACECLQGGRDHCAALR